MKGNGQVFVVFVAYLVVLCAQILQPCGSKHVRSSLSNPPELGSSTTHAYRLSTSKAQAYGASGQLLMPTKEASKSPQKQKLNSWLLKHHRNQMKPNGTNSPQHFLRPHSKTNLTARSFATAKRHALMKGNRQLPSLKHNLAFYLRLAKLRRLKGKSLPLKSVKSMANGGRLPLRAGKLPLQPSITEISSISKPRPPPLKSTKGGIILPFDIKDGRNKNWCKMVSFRQKIHHRDCEPVFIDTNVCYGQCMSYYVPHLFKSCASCMAASEDTVEVKLNCPGQTPNKLTKEVKIVNSCRCKSTSCNL